MSSLPPTGGTTTPTVHGGSPGGPKKRGWRGWDTGVRATVIGTVAGVLSLVVAVITPLLQRPSSDRTAPSTPGTAGTSIAASAATSTNRPPSTSTAGSSPVEYLSDFSAEAGSGYLGPVPRDVHDKPEFSNHPIAIACPSNQTNDTEHEVTYTVLGRYLRLEADVRPYYPANTDVRSAAYVTALIGIREKDGSLTITPAGIQQRATMSAPLPLSATIENAEKLIIQVQCGNPNGTIILTNARLTPA